MNKVITEARVILCQQLAEIARANNITQEMIAERTGMKQESISRMLRGKFSPRLDSLLLICRAVDALILLEDKNGNSEMEKVMREVK